MRSVMHFPLAHRTNYFSQSYNIHTQTILLRSRWFVRKQHFEESSTPPRKNNFQFARRKTPVLYCSIYNNQQLLIIDRTMLCERLDNFMTLTGFEKKGWLLLEWQKQIHGENVTTKENMDLGDEVPAHNSNASSSNNSGKRKCQANFFGTHELILE